LALLSYVDALRNLKQRHLTPLALVIPTKEGSHLFLKGLLVLIREISGEPLLTKKTPHPRQLDTACNYYSPKTISFNSSSR